MPSPSAPQTTPANVGLTVGGVVGNKYRIDGFLGEGGMGVVLSATHLDLDAPVAIKVVRDAFAQNPEIVARLLFEARAAARMRSAHIVRVLDVSCLDTGAPYIVMEHLRGADLGTVLSEVHALPVREAVSYVLQACEGLIEAHELGIIHRDMKPENLFLAETPEGRVLKILDFGISKDIGTAFRSSGHATLTKEGLAVGSPLYMSPEQMRASPHLDARADIWSLGAILFELIVGRCPFEEKTPALLCSKVMLDPAPSLLDFPCGASAALDAIVQRCLEKQASDRFQSAAELAGALRAFLAADVALAASAPPPAAPAPARKKTSLALVALAVLVAVASVGFSAWQSHGGSRWTDARRAAASELAREPARKPERQTSPAVPVAPAPAVAALVTPLTAAADSAAPEAAERPPARVPSAGAARSRARTAANSAPYDDMGSRYGL